MHPYQAPCRVPQIQPDQGQARYSMPILPKSSGQDDTGTKHTFGSGQLGSRDDGNTTLNRKGLLVMAKQPKTDDELLADIRHAAWLIGNASDHIPKTTAAIQRLESHANALHIYCKLLRQRLEAQQPTLTEGE